MARQVQTALIDENGNRTEFEYNAMNLRTVVRDALGHLYDVPYLQTHPLAEAVRIDIPRGLSRGAALHRALLDAIAA